MEFFLLSRCVQPESSKAHPSHNSMNTGGKAGRVCEADQLQWQNQKSMQLHFTLTPLVMHGMFIYRCNTHAHAWFHHTLFLFVFIPRKIQTHALSSFVSTLLLFVSFLLKARSEPVVSWNTLSKHNLKVSACVTNINLINLVVLSGIELSVFVLVTSCFGPRLLHVCTV